VNLSPHQDEASALVASPSSMPLPRGLASLIVAREWLPLGAARKRGLGPEGRKVGERRDCARLIASQWRNMQFIRGGNSRCPPSKVACPTKSLGGRRASEATWGSLSKAALLKGASSGRQNSKRATNPVANIITCGF
jgi:hypothetical protein